MDQQIKAAQIRKNSIIWGILTMVESSVCIKRLVSIAADEKNAVFLGFSISRLIMLTLMGILFIGGLIILYGAYRQISFYRRFERAIRNSAFRRILSAFSLIFFFLTAVVLYYLAYIEPIRYHAILERLKPIGILWILVCVQSFLFLNGKNRNVIKEKNPFYRTLFPSLLLFFILQIILFLLIRFTGLGITPDPFDWQPNGMSVQWWQLFGSFLGASLLSTIVFPLKKKIKKRSSATWLLFLFVWGLAAIIWTSVPTEEVLKSSYFMEITPPNYLPYPASDAAYFGLWSESILAGFGLKDQNVSRQLFVFGLAVLQRLSGNNILAAINLLTITLALIPAMLFLIGSRLHSHAAGLMTAGIAIFREFNTLYLAPHFGVSDSKMFLSDLPMMLSLLIFLFAFICWLQKPDSKKRLLLSGILLGLSGLIRSQILITIPVIWVILVFHRKDTGKQRFRNFVLFTSSILIVLAPALIRSVSLTGSVALEDMGIHNYELARRLSCDPNWQPTSMSGESEAAFAERMKQEMIGFLIDHPGKIVQYTLNHFVKDLVDSWLVLPVGIPTGFTVLNITDSAYQDVPGRLKGGSPVLFAICAFLIASGIASLWKRHGIAGLLPLILCPLYMLTAAVGRYSGWRFILPADWMIYFYFCCGVFEFVFWFRSRFIEIAVLESTEARNVTGILHRKKLLWNVLLILFILLGWAPPFSGIIPDQLKINSTAENQALIRQIGEHYGGVYADLSTEVSQQDWDVINGRTIYPRWFKAGDGLTSANPWVVNEIRDFNRLSFVLLNEKNRDVILPLRQPPEAVPHRTDCFVVGSFTEEGWFEGKAVVFPDILDSSGKPIIILSDKRD